MVLVGEAIKRVGGNVKVICMWLSSLYYTEMTFVMVLVGEAFHSFGMTPSVLA